MIYQNAWPERAWAMHSLHGALLAFPIACFTLTLLTDLSYWRTLNLLWLHFSEWLLLAGIVFGIVAALVRLVDFFVRGIRPAWLAVLGGVVVLLLAALNSFIHTSDGWTAVVPYGLIVSIVTVLAMLVTAWLDRMGVRHV